MQPILHRVPLADGSVATVPIFNDESLLLSFLNDSLCMRKEKFAPDYDIFTGQATSASLILAECIRVVCGNPHTIDIMEITLMHFH